MKAYEVYTDFSEVGSGIVFAENVGKAKGKAIRLEIFHDKRFIDIRVKRLPELDGMESEEPADNLWLNEKIRTILVKEHGWQCNEPNVYEKCENCCAKEYCDYYLDIIRGDEE